MATIKRTDNGQIVQHGYGYFYLADDFGNPCSNGWLDQSDAETALDIDGCDGWPEADIELDARGNPADDAHFARVQWDMENGPDEFVDALRDFLNDSPESWDDQIWNLADPCGPEAIWLPTAEAKRLEAAVATLPGYADDEAPEFAPNPLLFYYPPIYACDCGQFTGEPCDGRGTLAEMVVVEVMPAHLRVSHEAASNAGAWPHNGAERAACLRDHAGPILAAEGERWARIVDADPADFSPEAE